MGFVIAFACIFLVLVFLVVVLMMMTLAAGTSLWKFPEPLGLRLIVNSLGQNLPSMYQPDKQWMVWMRFSPIY